jgi:hypothetical protein
VRARAAAAFLGALALAGCASSTPRQLAIGDVDEEGCVLAARVALPPQPERVNDAVDASASSGRAQALDAWRSAGGGGVAPKADKVVRGDLYVDYYTCPKITIPEKRPD